MILQSRRNNLTFIQNYDRNPRRHYSTVLFTIACVRYQIRLAGYMTRRAVLLITLPSDTKASALIIGLLALVLS